MAIKHLKLNPKFKKTWTSALRSGDYVQGQDTLINHTVDHVVDPKTGYEVATVPLALHCCLGVMQHCLTGRQPNEGQNMPSKKMLKRVNMTHETANKLSEMNDSGKSFTVIANWIDKNL